MSIDWSEVKTWQPAIGSSLGFVALVVGALIHYFLNRRRDAKLRAEEATSIAVALYGEIVALRTDLALICRHIAFREWHGSDEQQDAHLLITLPKLEARLYGALASKIGLLAPDLVLGIVRFHSLSREVAISVPQLIDEKVRIYEPTATSVLGPATEAFTQIVPILRSIEGLAGITAAAPENLKLGRTEAILENDRLKREQQ